MTLFVDTSALIAIIAGEPDADVLADLLEADPNRLCSALSVSETVAGLCRSHVFPIPAARTHVKRFLDLADIRMVAIGEREFELTTTACTDCGKGRRPAALNMGDCFAYACAKPND